MQKKLSNPLIFRSKKGDGPTGGQAATLVVIIALLIVFYLLFIPPDVRDEILEGTGENVSDDDDSVSNETLLLETPGTLEEMEERDIEHLINSVYLFATEDAKVLEKIPALTVKQSAFTEKSVNISFTVDDKKNVENVLLTFLAKERKGTLIVKLNGREIYSADVSQENVEPLTLKRDYLVNGENNVEFSVSGVGAAFWRVNKYQLANVQVTADVTDVSDQLSKNLFIVSTTEKNNVERAVLRFTPDCIPGDVGALNVFVNGHSIYSAVPDCGAPTATEFVPDALRVGENQIVFKTLEGNYLVDLIKITSELKKSFQPVYYFEVEEEEFDDIDDETLDVFLDLTFAEGTEYKEGTIIINGIETGLYQTERIYEKKINDFIVEGSNSIKIIPDGRLEIVKLEVTTD